MASDGQLDRYRQAGRKQKFDSEFIFFFWEERRRENSALIAGFSFSDDEWSDEIVDCWKKNDPIDSFPRELCE